MEKLLKRGDVIRLEKGMMIRTNIPERIYEYDKPFSKETINAIIEIGRIYRSSFAKKDIIIGKIRHYLEENGIGVSDGQVEDFINSLNINYNSEELDTSIYVGTYIVSEADFEKNKTGPYKVKCFKILDPTIRAEFYQNVSFYYRNCIPEIEVIGRCESILD